MSAGFTPGPWILFPTPDDPDMVFEVCVDDGPICAVYGRHSEDANASLIAAAPELYEAVDAMVRAEHSGSGAAMAKARHKARAALAKANGEQVHSDPLPKEVGR